MLRTFFWIGWLFAYLFVSLPEYFKAKSLGKQGRVEEQQQLVRKKVKKWATVLLRYTKVKLVVTGTENLPPTDEAVAFAANHQSYFDIPVLLSGLDFPRALLAKKELSRVPLLRGWMNLLGCLYVDRHDVRASVAVLKDCEALLASGSSLIICPEGTRSKADEMGEFKAGIVRVATKAKVRIVPIAIDGTYKALEGNQGRMKKCTVRMVILPAIETEGLSREEQKALPAKLEGIIRAAKDDRPPGWQG
ncbi:1-acyl-sn-glycerol-3-phosphate acyltransferase [Ruminococcaceae bacterium OttesenSCG-928-A16]|nr:1-acyl-sn-glycerol-3-phosphate acyltransferase [Ruminococcaceae bacterium OttesenSCG-928-A16]